MFQKIVEGTVLSASLTFKFFFSLFISHRCREKQRKEASRLQTVNRKLTAMNKLLMEENDRLQKQVSHLVYENGFMRTQLQSVSSIILHLSLKAIICSCYFL